MRRALAILLSLLAASVVLAQQAEQKPATKSVDFSGMYSFLRDGEFVQITLDDQGKLSGFVSRYGDLDSDRGKFLDQFFTTASSDGTALDFTTETVHGVWFQFKGVVVHGEGRTPHDEGFYLIRGKLTRYSSDADNKVSAESRELTMKSFPQDVSMVQADRN